MFDKNLFNRNAFDRSVSSNNLTSSMTAAGMLNTQIVFKTTLNIRTLSSTSNMSCRIVMQQNVGIPLQGSSLVINTHIILLTRLANINYIGKGQLQSNISVKTPFRGSFSGQGDLKIDSRMYLLQYMDAHLVGNSGFENNMKLIMSLEPININGSSKLESRVDLQLPLNPNFNGLGELIVRRLSALNENILELININLLPGEIVTIDTDLLQVLFGSKEDVSSVTSESVFFELNPGKNEITISTDTNETLDMTAIWQNRWL